MTTKAAQKYRCGSFSSNWVKPLCCPWRFSLLRDHAGDRQLVKQPRRHYPDPFLGNPVLQAIFIWMSKVGSFAFSFLPVMFCIAIPLGLARENKGVAAFAGFVGYAVMNLAVNFCLTAKGSCPRPTRRY